MIKRIEKRVKRTRAVIPIKGLVVRLTNVHFKKIDVHVEKKIQKIRSSHHINFIYRASRNKSPKIINIKINKTNIGAWPPFLRPSFDTPCIVKIKIA